MTFVSTWGIKEQPAPVLVGQIGHTCGYANQYVGKQGDDNKEMATLKKVVDNITENMLEPLLYDHPQNHIDVVV